MMIKNSPPKTVLYYGLTLIIFTASALLRLYFTTGDLWLDEVWQIVNIEKISSIREIFTSINSYNNHYLNSILVFFTGPDAPFFVYRLPAVIGGIISMIFAFLIAGREGRVNGLIALTLIGFSYFFIILSSEVRGYGLLMGFAYGGLFYSIKILEENDWRLKNILVLWVFIILGFLSHLTFLHFYTGLIVWSACVILQKNAGARDRVIKLLKLHFIPAAFLIFLYFFSIRTIIHEDGPVRPLVLTIQRLFHFSFGLPLTKGLQYPVALSGLALTLFSIYIYKKSNRTIWIFFITVILISPVIVFSLMHITVFASRHFLMNALYLPLLFSMLLSRLFYKNQQSRILAAAAIFIFLCPQFAHFLYFSKYKRGTYRQAMEHIVELSEGRDVTVASDHDFRNFFLFHFYQSKINNGNTLHYIKFTPQSKTRPDFFILHDFDSKTFPETITIAMPSAKQDYRLSKVFPYDARGLSGYDWYIYKKVRP
ncbi:MAG: hypothetical protein AB1650_06610 [Candidatus Omnitrophota bacterium]